MLSSQEASGCIGLGGAANCSSEMPGARLAASWHRCACCVIEHAPASPFPSSPLAECIPSSGCSHAVNTAGAVPPWATMAALQQHEGAPWDSATARCHPDACHHLLTRQACCRALHSPGSAASQRVREAERVLQQQQCQGRPLHLVRVQRQQRDGRPSVAGRPRYVQTCPGRTPGAS